MGVCFTCPIEREVETETSFFSLLLLVRSTNQLFLSLNQLIIRNGLVVLNAAPFQEPTNLRFRRTRTKVIVDPRDERLKKYSRARPLYEQCSESEISKMCIDFTRLGLNRKLVVPRVQVAYDWVTYEAIRKDAVSNFRAGEDDLLEFNHVPETVECHPLERPGKRSPDGVLGDEIIS